MTGPVSANPGSLRYVQNLSVDPHVFQVDERDERMSARSQRTGTSRIMSE
jgi:hypothetical protein